MSRCPFYKELSYGSSRLPLKEVDRRVIVGTDPEFVFFRVPKAANSSVVWLLWQASNRQSRGHHGEVGQEAINQAKRQFRRGSGVTSSELARIYDRYWKFAIVRNPFTRTLSAYLHQRKKVENNPARYRRFRPHMVDFSAFCDFLHGGGHAANPHWARQVDFMVLGVDRLDFVGHVESLATDLPKIKERLFPGTPLDTGKAGRSHATGAVDLLDSYYDERTRRLVAATFADDFAAFGYDPSGLPTA